MRSADDPLRTSAAPALIAAGPPFHDAELRRYDAAFWAWDVPEAEIMATPRNLQRRPAKRLSGMAAFSAPYAEPSISTSS